MPSPPDKGGLGGVAPQSTYATKHIRQGFYTNRETRLGEAREYGGGVRSTPRNRKA